MVDAFSTSAGRVDVAKLRHDHGAAAKAFLAAL
jgi:hypothetical protein